MESTNQTLQSERSPWTKRFCIRELNRSWKGFCTLCICSPCGVNPLLALETISLISLMLGLMSFSMGVWLTVLVLLNANVPYKEQIKFEKLQVGSADSHDYFVNESSFIFAPVDNLRFYFMSMSTIAVLGGMGRAIASLCLFYYLRKKVVTGVVSWAWVILSMLSVVAVLVLTVDTFLTLSHNDLAPPHQRDFYFKEDTLGLYIFCHCFKYFIFVDFFLTLYFQWLVRWFHSYIHLTLPYDPSRSAHHTHS